MKVIASKVVFEGRLRAVREVVEHPDGRKFTHETFEHPGAVVIIPVLPGGELVLIDQYRHSVKTNILEFPAGTLEPGEDPAFTAQRELAEEIGMSAKSLVSLGTSYPAPGFCNEVQHFYLAKELYANVQQPDADEVISIVKMSSQEFQRAVKEGRLIDGKSMAIYLRAALMGLL